MGGRINMKQSLKKSTVKSKKGFVVRAMTQSLLADSKGNITVFINRRKRKLQQQQQQQQLQQLHNSSSSQEFDEFPTTITATATGTTNAVATRSLRMKRLFWVLIFACACWLIFYANAEHSLRKHNTKFSNDNNNTTNHIENGVNHMQHDEQEQRDEEAHEEHHDEKLQNAQEGSEFIKKGKYLSLITQHKLAPLPLKFITNHHSQQHQHQQQQHHHSQLQQKQQHMYVNNKKQVDKINDSDDGHRSQYHQHQHHLFGNASKNDVSKSLATEYNLFVIYTKENFQLHTKFELFTRSLLKYATVHIHMHVITDRNSKSSVEEILQKQMSRFHRTIVYTLYDVAACAERIVDIVTTMRPYFSATPKSYYGDALFYLSLGLHRIADEHLDRVILLDCDIVFRADVRELFAEFDRFSEEHLFGLAPELTPVYRHILYRYRVLIPGTNFGNPYYPKPPHGRFDDDKSISISAEEKARLKRRVRHGYPGLNSGVVLLHLQRLRASKLYNEQILPVNVQRITTKYSFHGHLGDQDFFTLFGYEFPHLIYRLDCVWNRQLCTWWKNHGYSEVFDAYFNCEGKVRIYHGNCNTRIPE